MLIKLNNRWFNLDGIDTIEPVSDNLETGQCTVYMRSGKTESVQMTAKAVVDTINAQIKFQKLGV